MGCCHPDNMADEKIQWHSSYLKAQNAGGLQHSCKGSESSCKPENLHRWNAENGCFNCVFALNIVFHNWLPPKVTSERINSNSHLFIQVVYIYIYTFKYMFSLTQGMENSKVPTCTAPWTFHRIEIVSFSHGGWGGGHVQCNSLPMYKWSFTKGCCITKGWYNSKK